MDLSQVILSNIMMSLGNHTNAVIEESIIRHMVLNSIRKYRVMFGEQYGELIIACDNKNYWRKQVFPYYKASRKKTIEKSELDWKAIFECLGTIRQELKQTFPYRVIDVESAEADDIIGTLCTTYGYTSTEQSTVPIMILSGDKDFVQLQRFVNVQQYSPVQKKFITHPDPIQYLREHIIRGDRGDGIPNVLSADNCFVIGERQRKITENVITSFNQQLDSTGTVDDRHLRNWKRNEQLIDLTQIPQTIQEHVLNQYYSQRDKTGGDLVAYFMHHRLKELFSDIGDFS